MVFVALRRCFNPRLFGFFEDISVNMQLITKLKRTRITLHKISYEMMCLQLTWTFQANFRSSGKSSIYSSMENFEDLAT